MPKDEKTIDIDTSGPGVDIELPEEKNKEKELENEATKDSAKPADTPEKSSEQLDVRDSSDSKDSEPKKEEVEEKKEEQQEEKQEAETKVEEKKELEEYSEGVKKRIAKLTKKWREAERQREAALDYAKGVQVEHSHLKTRFSRLEPDYVKALESRVVSGIDAAKAKLHTAREANDINAEVEAQKAIAQLGIEEARLNVLKEQQSRAKEREVRTPSLDQAIAPQPADPKAEAWAEDNEWFGKDNAMTYSAFDLHKKLTEEEGFDPKSDEYYVEVDKRMRLDFPHKFVNTKSQESTKPTQTVASATRSVKPGRKIVRLTSSQVAIARKLGVPLEEYAKQLRITKEA
jgi:DNA repair exonuclease SbcCD ATPase subunit